MRYKIPHLSLSNITFVNIIITALVFSIAFGFFSLKNTDDYYENRVSVEEKKYIKKNKKLVKDEILRVIQRINAVKKTKYDLYKSKLKERTDFLYNLLSSEHSKIHTTKELISIYKDTLANSKWEENTGYYYIFNSKGDVLYHATNKSNIGKNIFKIASDNKEFIEFANNTIKNKESYGQYKWKKPNTTDVKKYMKFAYAKKVKDLDIYVVAAVYKYKIDNKIKNLVFNELSKERFGDNDYGYFWIHDLDYHMILHPNKDLFGDNIKNFKTKDGQFLFQNMNKLVKEREDGYINYFWYRPNNLNFIDEKISYIHLIKDWNMVIGAGFYLTELKEMLNDEKKLLKDSLSEHLANSFILIGFLIFLTALSAIYVSKKVAKIERSQKEYLNMLEQYKLILDKSAVVSKTDPKGSITYVNDSFTNLSGYSRDELIGEQHNIVRHPESPKRQFRTLWRTIQNGKVWKGIIKNKNKNNQHYYNNTTIVPIKDANGNIIEYISAAMDVSELIENRTKLKSITSTDPLTGLGNRVSLINTISKNKNAVLALINIDRFKEVNDTQGHNIGDAIIKQLADRLFEFFDDKTYTIFRVQADIFAIYTTKVDEIVAENDMIQFINSVGKEVYQFEDIRIILTYTSGIASGYDDIFTYADIALSVAKNKKSVTTIYDPSMKNIDEYRQNIIWVDKLYNAISNDNITPYFQPIYNYHTQKVEKYECLMRLLEDGKVVLPSEYLDVAKKTKLYPELTYKMAEKAIDKFSKIDSEFSINLCVEDLMNHDLMNFIYDYAKKHKVFKKLVLEIVESEEIEDSEFISSIISRFKEKGVRIAIDDFGSGYSNYDYLISLQADYVKIDGSMTKHILEDERTAEVVKSIVNFAKKSNMKTIAEFVSSKEISDKVKSLGVDFAQGFYYGKAEPELLE